LYINKRLNKIYLKDENLVGIVNGMINKKSKYSPEIELNFKFFEEDNITGISGDSGKILN
jgi:hypothetical protein